MYSCFTAGFNIADLKDPKRRWKSRGIALIESDGECFLWVKPELKTTTCRTSGFEDKADIVGSNAKYPLEARRAGKCPERTTRGSALRESYPTERRDGLSIIYDGRDAFRA